MQTHPGNSRRKNRSGGLIISILYFAGILLFVSCNPENGQKPAGGNINYIHNRPPLLTKPFIELPLGSIKARGWLLDQLKRQASGLTGHLDELYKPVVGPRNGWLGGDGDGWERGPYWLDGLVPLAYTLHDSTLIAKAKPWIEWSLQNQQPDGYFGPVPFKSPPDPEPGLQKGLRKDWWPKIVMLKVLKQYYEATGDKRVISLMTRYFQYQLKQLPETPLDHWSFWANRRGGDNLMSVYWLYNITGDRFLLDLGEIIHKQTFPYTRVFLNRDTEKQNDVSHLYPDNTGNKYPFDQDRIDQLRISQIRSFHGVNLAQGIKEPVVYYQAHPDSTYLRAVQKAFRDIEFFHGQAQGMFGADEPVHGNDPVRGIEFCSVVEMMYSLETMLTITGNVTYADHLERIAYNALPTQANDDFTTRQYFQSANQAKIVRGRHGFFEDDNNGGTSLCYGLLTGYPCCTCNMHQGWPKFTRNLFYATPDNGMAALVFAPCEVNMLVADHVKVNVVEKTFYPFGNNIKFIINPMEESDFPFHIRIPSWCDEAMITVNRKDQTGYKGGEIITLNRTWKKGDTVSLDLPMKVSVTRWYMNSVAVERGPLVYSLKIRENRRLVRNNDKWGDYQEVNPVSAWNYGLTNSSVSDPSNGFRVISSGNPSRYPWNSDNAPLMLKTQGKVIPDWKLYNSVPGPLPPEGSLGSLRNIPPDSITLIPYGCTTLRITEFPVVE